MHSLVQSAVRRLRAEQRAAILWCLCIAASAAILGHASALWSNGSAALTLDLAAAVGFGCL